MRATGKEGEVNGKLLWKVSELCSTSWNEVSCHAGDDLIVTPFAQILASLKSVRNNYVCLTNVAVPDKNRRSSAVNTGATGGNVSPSQQKSINPAEPGMPERDREYVFGNASRKFPSAASSRQLEGICVGLNYSSCSWGVVTTVSGLLFFTPFFVALRFSQLNELGGSKELSAL
ncbi:unnamed protein product [Notodromas monacha]|uniref:3',5'-cyclic-AMP phosphodiesterase n=1 Tax=Notodromas monacha TaxID=399045 RepID=A0A7R9BII8_9CRUS|nr:unnamed protein product [Notodromas monacha]CAG0915267.1 unnamed protein product [Notodromas monacha]